MSHPAFDGRMLGVLGGMGPMASAYFMTRLTALTPADTDQQHIPTVLWSDPRVPDRPAGHSGAGADPLPWMQYGLRKLEDAGAQAIAIPCNTAHLWYEALAANAQVRVLHIVDAVISDLRRQGIDRGRIGVLGTATTLKLGLYQKALEAQGFQCLVPDEDELQRYCTTAIRLVKSNRLSEATEPASKSVARLQGRAADAVVLGCTELPLALPHSARLELGLPVTDSIDALALAAIAWYQDGCPEAGRDKAC